VVLGGASDVRFSDCTVRDCFKGFALHGTSGVALDHCLVYRTRAHGIICNGANPHLTITGCILKAGGISGQIYYLAGPMSEGFHSDGNCLVQYLRPPNSFRVFAAGRMLNRFADYQRASAQDRHSISVAPGFVDETPGREDLRLAPGSPCRGRAPDGSDLGPRR